MGGYVCVSVRGFDVSLDHWRSRYRITLPIVVEGVRRSGNTLCSFGVKERRGLRRGVFEGIIDYDDPFDHSPLSQAGYASVRTKVRGVGAPWVCLVAPIPIMIIAAVVALTVLAAK